MSKHLSVVRLEDRNRWDEIVDSFPEATIYYTNGYAKAASGDGETVLLYFQGETMRAMHVTCIKCIEGTSYKDMSSIAGFYGWIVDGKNDADSELLTSEILRFAKDNGIVAEFIRCNPQIESCKDVCFGNRRRIGQSVIVKVDEGQDIWMNMHSGNRNCIKKASNCGVQVHIAKDDSSLENFKRIYNETMRKKEAFDYIMPDDYYNELFGIRNGIVFNAYAEYDGKVISSALFLGKNKKAYYHLSGSDDEYAHLGSMKVVLYVVACYLQGLGYDTLDLGGGVKSRDDSLLAFKKRFTKEDVTPFYVLDKVYDQDAYDELSKGIEPSVDFFPAYRRKE